MSISSVNSYSTAQLQWQGQQLKSTGTGSASSSSSNSLSTLFNSSTSMTSQLSSMVEPVSYTHLDVYKRQQ